MSPFHLVYVNFPAPADHAAGGFTMRATASGKITIMINAIIPEEDQIRFLKHELSHILLGHLEDERVTDDLSYLDEYPEIEDDANRYADQMTDDEFHELMTYQVGETLFW